MFRWHNRNASITREQDNFAEVAGLLTAGDLNRELFGRLQKFAVGYKFELHLSDENKKYSFMALPAAKDQTSFFLDQSGEVISRKPDAQSVRGQPR